MEEQVCLLATPGLPCSSSHSFSEEYCSFDFESVVCDFTYQAHDPLQGGETFEIEHTQPRTMGC